MLMDKNNKKNNNNLQTCSKAEENQNANSEHHYGGYDDGPTPAKMYNTEGASIPQTNSLTREQQG